MIFAKKRDVINYLMPLFFVFFILGDLFSLTIFQYADEIFEIICFLWLIDSFINGRNQIFILGLVTLFLIGICGNVFFKFEVSVIHIIEDFFLALKWPIVFLSVYDFYSKKTKKIEFNFAAKIMYLVACLLSIIIFIDCLYKTITVGGQFYFYNNSYAGISAIYSFIFSFIIYAYKKKLNFYSIIPLGMNFYSTIMSKSTFSLVLYVVSFLFILYDKRIKCYLKGNSFLIIACLFSFCVVLSLSYTKIVDYFFNSNAPRSIFLTNCFVLANQCFPFGVGLGLYGGSIAANNYSPVYTYLGFENIWAVSRGSNFLIDSFFPQILGEFGYIGFLVYILLILYCYNKIRNKNILFKAIFLIFIVSGISSNFLNSSVGTTMICSLLSLLFMKEHNIRLLERPKVSLYEKQYI